MSELIVYGECPTLLAELRELPTADLRQELARQLTLSAQHLLRLAALVRILEERGEDLSDLKLGLLGYLRQIAYGQIVPEVVVRFAAAPMLIQRIARLPLPEQARLGRGESVPVYFRREDGASDLRMVDPLRLPAQEIRQVFGEGQLRSQAEQLLILDQRLAAARATHKTTAVSHGRAHADQATGTILVGRIRLLPADVLAALADLRSPGAEELLEDIAPEEQAYVPVKLTTEEHLSLKIAAHRAGVSMAALVRRALLATGVLHARDVQ